MSTDRRYSELVRLTLPIDLGRRLEDMAETREMTLNALVSELVLLGLTSLRYPDLGPIETLKGIDPGDDGFGRG